MRVIISPVLFINITHWGSQSLAGLECWGMVIFLYLNLSLPCYIWLTCIPAILGLLSIMTRWTLDTVPSSIIFKFQNRTSQIVTGYPEAWLLLFLYSRAFKHLSFNSSHCGIKYHKSVLWLQVSSHIKSIEMAHYILLSTAHPHPLSMSTLKHRIDWTDRKCFKITKH